MKRSEKAWSYKHTKADLRCRRRGNYSDSKKLTFLDFVRYMRWYTIDARSYLYLRLYPRTRDADGNRTPATARKVLYNG